MIGQREGEHGEDVADLFGSVFLEVDQRGLTGRDLLAAGVVSGRWQELESRLSEGLGLVAAERPTDAERKAEVQAFRLARSLLSAEDMRAWMHARGLTMSDVNGVAQRVIARRRGGAGHPVTAAQVRSELAAEAICTGMLTELGWWLADRILSAKVREVTVEPITLEDRRIKRLVFEEVCTVAGATIAESGVERAQRLAWIAALDDAHREWEAGATSERDLARVLREHELDWCRLELDELRFGSPGAAAEAARQLAEAIEPQQVASAAGVPVTTHRLLLADAPAEVARNLAGAVAGDVAGPVPDGEEHLVARVRERTAPDVGDPELMARARGELLVEAASRLRAGKVRWYERA